ncbi:MAG TPA: HAD-IA family hydrolase [Puia sp.]|jgi:phosphonatase-like hydrolase|nr:HAD-IA family hydrolase [Puia sp.]
MDNIQLVVFDIAGTTVRDSGNVADAFIAAFRAANVEIPVDEVKRVMGWRKMDAIRQLLDRFLPTASVDRDALIVEIHDRFIQHMLSFYQQDPDLRPLPHAEALFSSLHDKGIKVALNTGFTRTITDTILHRLHWDNGAGYIDSVICSDEVPQGRPSPDMINRLMQRLNISSAHNVLKVGDTEVDVEEGRNAGCRIVVSVTTGAYTRQQLQEYGPDHIIDNLEELLPIIEKA